MSLFTDMENCRGQAYDGAGAMAGNVKGVSSRISQFYPKAIYIHCNSHVLNLCIVKGLSIREIQNMMDFSDSVCRFYKFSPKRQASLEKFVDNEFVRTKTTKYKLKEMCRTCWVERHDAFEVFCELFIVVVKCLQNIDKNENGTWNRKTVSDARSLLKGILYFPFIVTLIITKNIMSYSKILSVALQGTSVDIVKAFRMISLVKRTLQDAQVKITDFNKK